VSGPKIIPSNKEAVTKGTRSFVTLLRKVVMLARVILKFIFNETKKGYKPFLVNYLVIT
jgi:seryl-tRNA synthetase